MRVCDRDGSARPRRHTRRHSDASDVQPGLGSGSRGRCPQRREQQRKRRSRPIGTQMWSRNRLKGAEDRQAGPGGMERGRGCARVVLLFVVAGGWERCKTPIEIRRRCPSSKTSRAPPNFNVGNSDSAACSGGRGGCRKWVLTEINPTLDPEPSPGNEEQSARTPGSKSGSFVPLQPKTCQLCRFAAIDRPYCHLGASQLSFE